MYESPKNKNWKGRIDGEGRSAGNRWHQVVQKIDLSDPEDFSPDDGITRIAFLGFCSDEGVRRNQGRTGATKGPSAIRNALSNLAVHFKPEELQIYDAGDILCSQGNLEAAQLMLSLKVQGLLAKGIFPLVFGGGHEVAYGHYKAADNHLMEARQKHVGIINFDAHFDLRAVAKEVNSGTPFRQILEEYDEFKGNMPYLCLGIQEASNTRDLFEVADKNQVQYIFAENVNFKNEEILKSQIATFTSNQKAIYLTIDLDVFSAAFAPGVSAPTIHGIFPDIAIELIRFILDSNKVVCMDVAELNPDLDIDNRTAKLAASIIYEVVKWRLKKSG